jgi:hypothetical protein
MQSASSTIGGEAREPVNEPEIIPPQAQKQSRREGGAMPGPTVEKLQDATGGATKPKSNAGRKTRAEHVNDLAEQVFGLHQLAHALTGLNSVTITKDEALKLAGPAHDVCEKYKIAIGVLTSPEMKLLGAAGLIYGPMLLALRLEMLLRNADAATPAGSNVHDFAAAQAARAGNIPPDGMTKEGDTGPAVDLSAYANGAGEPAAE